MTEALTRNLDLYITGEPSHNLYWYARENNINVIFGGHYNTGETGVNLLQNICLKNFSLDYKFIDLPTGF